MGTKTREVGGGPATGLGNDLIAWLQSGLNTGSFGPRAPAGAGAMGDSMGMAGILNDILSGGAGQVGGSLMDMISRDIENQVGATRARFGVGGGTAFGTPGQHAEGTIRAESAPRMTQAIGQLQLGTIMNLLGLMSQLGSKGISQRSVIAEPSPWASAAAIAAPIASAGINAFAPGLGSAAGAAVPALMPTQQTGMMMPGVAAPPMFAPPQPFDVMSILRGM